jgi:glutamate/tyrosine decarboxylase-like PLP-dependent enzyme
MAERRRLSQVGRPADEVMGDLEAMKRGDADWRGGKVPLYVFKATDEVDRLGRAAFEAYFTENALGAKRAFSSLRRMEDEVVEMALDLFSAPSGASGMMTTGGTESVVLAVQACRDHVRASRADSMHRGNLVLCETAHPAFDKAARLMDLEVRRVAMGADLRAVPEAMAAALDRDTIMMVGSAPCFPFGVIDPIAELGEIAAGRGIWFHVDACVGGYLAPFAKRIGRKIPDFDFAVTGVTSLSADLHKFGFCPKPASTLFFRAAELGARVGFDLDVWPNGRFRTATLVGTRPGGGVAAAWAILEHLGLAGYEAIATRLMDMTDRYRQGVAAIDGLAVHGDPHLSVVAFGATGYDVFAVAEALAGRGWVPGLTQTPRGIHRMMSLLHEGSMSDFLADLRRSVAEVRAASAASTLAATY